MCKSWLPPSPPWHRRLRRCAEKGSARSALQHSVLGTLATGNSVPLQTGRLASMTLQTCLYRSAESGLRPGVWSLAEPIPGFHSFAILYDVQRLRFPSGPEFRDSEVPPRFVSARSQVFRGRLRRLRPAAAPECADVHRALEAHGDPPAPVLHRRASELDHG